MTNDKAAKTLEKDQRVTKEEEVKTVERTPCMQAR